MCWHYLGCFGDYGLLEGYVKQTDVSGSCWMCWAPNEMCQAPCHCGRHLTTPQRKYLDPKVLSSVLELHETGQYALGLCSGVSESCGDLSGLCEY